MSWAFLIARLVKNPPAMQETLARSTEEGLGYPLQYSWMSLVAQLVKKKSTPHAGDLGLIPGLGRSSGGGKGYPFQYSGLQNSMDCIVHGVAKNLTPLSNVHFMKASTKCPNFNTHILSKWHVRHWQLVNFSCSSECWLFVACVEN